MCVFHGWGKLYKMCVGTIVFKRAVLFLLCPRVRSCCHAHRKQSPPRYTKKAPGACLTRRRTPHASAPLYRSHRSYAWAQYLLHNVRILTQKERLTALGTHCQERTNTRTRRGDQSRRVRIVCSPIPPGPHTCVESLELCILSRSASLNASRSSSTDRELGV